MPAETPRTRLEQLPLPLFAAVMGLCGLAMVWRQVEQAWQLPAVISTSATALAAAVFVVLLLAFALKSVRHWTLVASELRHPVRINFLPAISINLMLLALLTADALPGLSSLLWKVGAGLHLLLTLVIVTIWLETERPLPSLNPAWFIPAVGNVLVPLVAVPDGYPMVGWFFMAIGLFFWGMLVTLVFFRLVTGPELEPPMRPTLVVLLAPPAVSYLSWLALTGETGIVATMLYQIALFTFLLLLLQIPRFIRLAFFPSWWAYTFPLAAFTSASFVAAGSQPGPTPQALLAILATLTTLIIALVAVRTLVAVVQRRIEP